MLQQKVFLSLMKREDRKGQFTTSMLQQTLNVQMEPLYINRVHW